MMLCVFCQFFKDLVCKIKDLFSWQLSQIQQGFSANLTAKLFFQICSRDDAGKVNGKREQSDDRKRDFAR